MRKLNSVVRQMVMWVLVLTTILANVSSVSASTSAAASGGRFPDVDAKAWYASDLTFITNDTRHILEGSTDGRFYPENPLTVEQYVKCIVVAAGYRPSATGGHWAQPYIDQALTLGILSQGQFESFSAGITRGEMAVVTMAAIASITGETLPSYDAQDIQARMGDYLLIPAEQRDAVCMAYHLGILGGTPDGKYHAEWVLSRSQAVAVIRRVIDASARLKLLPIGTTEGTDMWSDEEFRAFMSTDEWKNYLNPNTIAGMQDGVLLFYEFYFPDIIENPDVEFTFTREPAILPEPEYSKYYQIAKTLGYYAKKYNGKASVTYSKSMGGGIEFDLSDKGSWIGLEPNLCFKVSIEDVEKTDPYIYRYYPEAHDDDLQYKWVLSKFYLIYERNSHYMSGSTEEFDVSNEKYTIILKKIASILYGEDIGEKVFGLLLDQYNSIYSEPGKTLMLNGIKIADSITVYSYYPTVFGSLDIFTSEVE